jgi:signal transduction histidine kinase
VSVAAVPTAPKTDTTSGTAPGAGRRFQVGRWLVSRRPLTLALLLAVLTIGPLVALSSLTVLNANQAMTEAANHRLAGSSTLAAAYVEKEMTSLAELENGYAHRLTLIHALRDGNHARWDSVAILSVLKDFRGVKPGTRLAGIFDVAGSYWGDEDPATSPDLIGKNYSVRDWYAGVMRTGQPYVSEAYVSAVAGNPLLVAISAPVWADGMYAPVGTMVGVFVIGYELSVTQAMFSQFAAGQGVQIEVTDQRGVIVARSGAVPTKLVTDRSAGVAGALKGRASLARETYRGEDYFEAYGPLSTIGWTLVAREPASLALSNVRNVDAFVLTISIPLVLILIAATAAAYVVLRQRQQAQQALAGVNANLERRVASRTAELEASNRELEAFTYSVSHDLRAPLRAMAGFAQLLLDKSGPSLNLEGREYAGRINANAVKMGKLIDDLLQFSRLGRSQLQSRPVDMTRVARAAIAELRDQAEASGVAVELADLPPARGDAALLQQVFTNLVSNGIKFSRGRPEARVQIGSHVEDGTTVYDVSDNGVGFDMRYASKLFGVFQRLHSQVQYEGTGVGLALVHRIVQRHGGRVWGEAEVDKGATFHFTVRGD